jgi:hypothetical protein
MQQVICQLNPKPTFSFSWPPLASHLMGRLARSDGDIYPSSLFEFADSCLTRNPGYLAWFAGGD